MLSGVPMKFHPLFTLSATYVPVLNNILELSNSFIPPFGSCVLVLISNFLTLLYKLPSSKYNEGSFNQSVK